MKTAICYLKSISPYSQSKHYETPKLNEKERPGDYEDRTWRDRLHYDDSGMVYIPCTQFANSIKVAAKYLNLQIPGKGKSTYTKNFEAGIMVINHLPLNIQKDDVQKESYYVPSDGRRGGTTRVTKHFGVIPAWEGEVTYYILDDTITKDVFERVLRECGQLIGVGRFRPRNCGWYGRFEVKSIKWEEK